MNLVLVELLDAPCSPRPAYVRLLSALSLLWSWSISFGRSACFSAFFSFTTRTPQRACPRSFTLLCLLSQLSTLLSLP